MMTFTLSTSRKTSTNYIIRNSKGITIMKTISTIILALLLFIGISPLNAQSISTSLSSVAIPEGWTETDNWLQAYRENISANGSASWIAEVVDEDAEVLTNSKTAGLILLIEENNEEALSNLELAEMAFVEGNGTRLSPVEPAEAFEGQAASAVLHGSLNGQPVHVQKVCLPANRDGKIVSVMTIVPAKARTFAGKTNVFKSGRSIANSIMEQQFIAMNKAE